MYVFGEHQQLFASLLTKTYGVPHGRYPTDMEDDAGSVWTFLFPIGHILAKQLVWEASGHEGAVPEASHHVAPYLPSDNHFLLFSGDKEYLFALFQRQERFYILRAEGKRFYQLQLRGRFHSEVGSHIYEVLRALYGDNT